MPSLPLNVRPAIDPGNEIEDLMAVVGDLTAKASNLSDQLEPMLARIKDAPSTAAGVSLLEVKFHTLLSYLSHLGVFTLMKLQGKRPITGHPSIEALVEARTVLEKIRPLEQKLKYQIDKLLKTAVMHADGKTLVSSCTSKSDDKTSTVHDPLAFKPNPSAFIDAADAGEEGIEQPTTGVYRPPRLVPMPYDQEDDEENSRGGRLTTKLKERSSRSRLLKDLRNQFDERPEEMSAEGMGYGGRDAANTIEDRTWTERETFEEENFMRLNMTKTDKKLVKKLSQKGALMRFQNEFKVCILVLQNDRFLIAFACIKDLDTDFNDLAGLNRAVESEDRSKFGKEGLLRKRAERQAGMKSAGGSLPGMSSKRKFGDASEAISSFARTQKSALGKGQFKKALKRQRK
jgi:hypothetical protein